MGFELMNDDECPPEFMEDGVLRIYCVPVYPVDDMQDEVVELDPADAGHARVGMIAGCAALAGATLASAPYATSVLGALVGALG